MCFTSFGLLFLFVFFHGLINCLVYIFLNHFIEFGFALYEKAYITSIITIVFGILDLLAAYIVKEKAEPFDSADDGRKSV